MFLDPRQAGDKAARLCAANLGSIPFSDGIPLSLVLLGASNSHHEPITRWWFFPVNPLFGLRLPLGELLGLGYSGFPTRVDIPCNL